jgi:hypothetical protein
VFHAQASKRLRKAHVNVARLWVHVSVSKLKTSTGLSLGAAMAGQPPSWLLCWRVKCLLLIRVDSDEPWHEMV